MGAECGAGEEEVLFPSFFFTFLILNVEFWFILSGILCDFELHKNESR